MQTNSWFCARTRLWKQFLISNSGMMFSARCVTYNCKHHFTKLRMLPLVGFKLISTLHDCTHWCISSVSYRRYQCYDWYKIPRFFRMKVIDNYFILDYCQLPMEMICQPSSCQWLMENLFFICGTISPTKCTPLICFLNRYFDWKATSDKEWEFFL